MSKAFQARNLCGFFSKASSVALASTSSGLFSFFACSRIISLWKSVIDTLWCLTLLTSEEVADSVGGVSALGGDGLAVRAAFV